MDQSTPRPFSPGNKYGTNFLEVNVSHTWAQLSLAGAHTEASGEGGKLKLREWGREVTQMLCEGRVQVPLKSENVIECDQLDLVAETLRNMAEAHATGISFQGKIAVQMRPLKELISAMIQMASTVQPEFQAALDAVLWAKKVKAAMKPH